MGTTAKALVPQLVRGSIERAPVTALSLSDLLARAQTLNVNEIRQLARFVPVIIVIPEALPGQTAPPKVPCNRSPNETAQAGRILGILSKATDQTRVPGQDGEFSFGQVSVSFNQQRALLKDAFRGLFLVPFYGTKLRESSLVRMLISSRGLGIADKDSGSTAGYV